MPFSPVQRAGWPYYDIVLKMFSQEEVAVMKPAPVLYRGWKINAKCPNYSGIVCHFFAPPAGGLE